MTLADTFRGVPHAHAGAGMIRLRGGRFRMGSDAHYPEEAPARDVEVADFFLDPAPVTNAEFALFVAATGYVTFAERLPDPAHYPGILPEMDVAGSIVFEAPEKSDAVGPDAWWRYIKGAHWRCPYGPGADVGNIDNHPVVQIVWEDALAYAEWVGKRLPTEIEAEFAARGGIEGASYAWGEELTPNGEAMANIWREGFPFSHPAKSGPPYTTSVKSYAPNGYGLYDMIGNVWEWTSTEANRGPSPKQCCRVDIVDRPSVSKVLKGGSHLCAPNYCQRYRPAARWFQPIDTSTTHVGFRCALSAEQA